MTPPRRQPLMMPKGRLGSGLLSELPGDHPSGYGALVARITFLEVLSDTVPECVEDLRELFETLQDLGHSLDHRDPELRQRLVDWRERWRLIPDGNDWISVAAFETLTEWSLRTPEACQIREELQEQGVALPPVHPIDPSRLLYPLQALSRHWEPDLAALKNPPPGTFDPFKEDLTDYVARAQRHAAEILQQAEAAGFCRTLVAPKFSMHCRWLCLTLCRKMSTYDIALAEQPHLERDSREHRSAARNVHTQINKVATKLNLRIPKPQR
jgi:hypothetical protein